jgi:phage terminase large subunit-like protein
MATAQRKFLKNPKSYDNILRMPSPDLRDAVLGNHTRQIPEIVYFDWEFWAHPKQLAPSGDWAVWVLKAGRGFGKTRAGAGWVHSRAMEQRRWIALVARTQADARDYMIEGPGGLLHNTPPAERPHFEPSKRRLTWPNGSSATVYSDDEPDQIRGFSGDTAWLDEFAKFKHPLEVWQTLEFAMRERSNDRPRTSITTTPRPLQILKDIARRSDCVVVEGSSYENKHNLDPKFFEGLAKYEGTRIGRQEIHGEILEDVAGALWSRNRIDQLRVAPGHVPTLKRVVVAIDPSASSGDSADETGLLVVGVGEDGHGYVLEDASGRLPPTAWAERAVSLFETWKADRVIAEINNGGDLVETTLRVVHPGVPFRAVRASRGKVTRAEPVSALYERGLVHHVGVFPVLEDQLCVFTADFDRRSAGYSPDRLDALVWGLTELLLEWTPAAGGVYEFMRLEAEKVVGAAEMKRIEEETAAFFATSPAMPKAISPPGAIPPLDFGWNFSRVESREMVTLRAPNGTTGVDCYNGQHCRVGNDGMVKVPAYDVPSLLRMGFKRP